MSEQKPGELTDTVSDNEDDRSLTRRKFLKRGAAVGVGAAALYMAPSMSSTRANRAYANTGAPPCTDDVRPLITGFGLGTGTPSGLITEVPIAIYPPGPLPTSAQPTPISAVATDNVALQQIEIEIVSLSLTSVQPIECDPPSTQAGVTLYIPVQQFPPLGPDVLPPPLPEPVPGLVKAIDCCGNVTTHEFQLSFFEGITGF